METAIGEAVKKPAAFQQVIGDVLEISWLAAWTQVQGSGLPPARCGNCGVPSSIKLTVTFEDAAGRPVIVPPSTYTLNAGGAPFRSLVPRNTARVRITAEGEGRTTVIDDNDVHINNCYKTYVQCNAALTRGGNNVPPFPQAIQFESDQKCSDASDRGSSHSLPITVGNSVRVFPIPETTVVV